MAANQPHWPREWLMTDERIGNRMWDAIDALPAGAGILFRHYSLGQADRLRLGRRVADAALACDLVLGVAGSQSLAAQLGARLVHNPDEAGPLPCSMAVHDMDQAESANKLGAALIFVGPVYPTRSHPGAANLGPDLAAELAERAGCPAIVLGGMDRSRFDALQAAKPAIFHGYAGIDCWLRT